MSHALDMVEAPPDAHQTSGKVRAVDEPGITISRRTLGVIVAAVLALFTGGQAVSLKMAADQPEVVDRHSASLGVQVAGLAQRVDTMAAASATREAHFDRVLAAILVYQIESDRYWRETRDPKSPPRSQELEAAAARLRALAGPG